MIVTKFDSQNLDNELHNTLWSMVQKHSPIAHSLNFKKALFDTLIFYFSTSTQPGSHTSTYGSSLTGIDFETTKSRLFLANIIIPYLLREIHTKLLSYSTSSKSIATLLEALTEVWSFQTFLQFLATNKGYLSLTHKILRIKPSLETVSSFYASSITSNINFQSTQLLYNAALQFLTNQLLRSTLLTRFLKRTSQIPHKKQGAKAVCPNCGNSPVIPYTSTCCSTPYCYICMLKAIKANECPNCYSQNIQGVPFYAKHRSYQRCSENINFELKTAA
ncbi:ubiquitin-protein ligase peroxin 2 LALA0_S11e02960g [Lachancea lanzarotensis]|uniref:LALA0S11e02960g1_1 n=1 Tax=Lachancea lanzarotensis TaxID=1245769 RepID=A0A0C7N900_9SACH|nr:uncharacterized protein LALA0_S11e02960g [Lachancea lanzarotensis]CEP64388.1 LALA0S11e02960g1_1 [Lachancea lanzarotensis]